MPPPPEKLAATESIRSAFQNSPFRESSPFPLQVKNDIKKAEEEFATKIPMVTAVGVQGCGKSSTLKAVLYPDHIHNSVPLAISTQAHATTMCPIKVIYRYIPTNGSTRDQTRDDYEVKAGVFLRLLTNNGVLRTKVYTCAEDLEEFHQEAKAELVRNLQSNPSIEVIINSETDPKVRTLIDLPGLVTHTQKDPSGLALAPIFKNFVTDYIQQASCYVFHVINANESIASSKSLDVIESCSAAKQNVITVLTHLDDVGDTILFRLSQEIKEYILPEYSKHIFCLYSTSTQIENGERQVTTNIEKSTEAEFFQSAQKLQVLRNIPGAVVQFGRQALYDHLENIFNNNWEERLTELARITRTYQPKFQQLLQACTDPPYNFRTEFVHSPRCSVAFTFKLDWTDGAAPTVGFGGGSATDLQVVNVRVSMGTVPSTKSFFNREEILRVASEHATTILGDSKLTIAVGVYQGICVERLKARVVRDFSGEGYSPARKHVVETYFERTNEIWLKAIKSQWNTIPIKTTPAELTLADFKEAVDQASRLRHENGTALEKAVITALVRKACEKSLAATATIISDAMKAKIEFCLTSPDLVKFTDFFCREADWLRSMLRDFETLLV